MAVFFVNVVKAEDFLVDFYRDLDPISSDKCFQCHGPDVKQRKAELRLDISCRAFTRMEDGGYAIIQASRKKVV